MKHYDLGLVSVSFRKYSPEEILTAMQQADLKFIEWGSDVHAPYDNISRLEALAAMQKQFGIKCSSYGTYFRFGQTPVEELEGYIQAAKILGTSILRLWCGSKSGKDMTDEEQTSLLAECRMAAEIARQNDVVFSMECHRNTFTENPGDAVWLMEQVNSPHFRMYYQPFQWQNAIENTENAKKLAPYTTHIHVFNWKKEEKFPLIEAVEEWQGYLSQFTTPRTLLLEFMPNDTIEELAEEAIALKKITGGVV